MKQLDLIDASVYVFRGYFSLPSSMTDPQGAPVNAVYGYANFLAQLLAAEKSEYIGAAFDKSLTTSFRNEIYPPYKANRELPPADLEAQFTHCIDLTEALGIATFIDETYEADDLIGTLATRMRARDFRIRVLSSDKDLAQLIDGEDILWDFAKDRRLDAAGVLDHFGVKPAQIIDLLALVGDKVDNIPGVAGIGQKSAAALLEAFGTLDQIYERLQEVPDLPLRGAKRVANALATGREDAFLSRKLATIVTDIPLEGGEERLARASADRSALAIICDRLGFGETIRKRLEAVC